MLRGFVIGSALAVIWAALAQGGTIAVFYALDEDGRGLRGQETAFSRAAAGVEWQSFRLGCHRVVAAKMGAGCVETAVTAATVLAREACDVVVSIGPAGGLDNGLQVGEVVRVREVVGYQRGTWQESGWAMAREARWSAGMLPEVFLPAVCGMREVGLASGEGFVACERQRERLRQETGCEAVDMNSFGLVQACKRAGARLVILRVISDQAGDAAAGEFGAFAGRYDGRLGRRVREWVEQMPILPEEPEGYEVIRGILRGGEESDAVGHKEHGRRE